jgi:hypothetical protein
MRFRLKNVLVVTALVIFLPLIFLSLYNERGEWFYEFMALISEVQ